MAEITAESRGNALNSLRSQPDNFRWAIPFRDVILKKDDIIREVEDGSEIGDTIIGLMKGMDLGGNDPSNLLGKRYRCLVCGTEALSTKAGAGRVECCGQRMAVWVPKPLVSSD